MSEVVQQYENAPPLRQIRSQTSQSTVLNTRTVDTKAKPIKRTSKLTLGGLAYVAVTVFLAVGAINSQNNLLFWMFGVAIATLIVSGLFSGNALMRVRLNAQAIPDANAGESIRIRYSIINHSKFFPMFAALITEMNLKRNGSDSELGEFKPAGIIHLGPRQRARSDGTFIPLHRGHHTLEKLRLSTRFPFGLLQKSLIFNSPRSFTVLPYQLKIKPEIIRVVQGEGEEVRKRTHQSGASNEYWGMREYSPGDPKRRIAWKQSARHQRLIVIEHAQPIATKLWIWLLNSGSELNEENIFFERSVSIAASLLAQASKRSIPVGIWAPSLGVRISPATGQAHRLRSLHTLGVVEKVLTNAQDQAPNALITDDIIAIGTPENLSKVPGHIRGIDVTKPMEWLSDPKSLPKSLVHESREGDQ
ncbi:MAG: DUF58 domain-containing protein [Phycisphaerales bacterium]|nr:DUF58 domain-containing protein [Phycisphaerales bacterium]